MADKVQLLREECIGCGACAAVAPDLFDMAEDGKSKMVGGKKVDDNIEEKETDKKLLNKYKEAAEACPVNVIHIFKDGKKII